MRTSATSLSNCTLGSSEPMPLSASRANATLGGTDLGDRSPTAERKTRPMVATACTRRALPKWDETASEEARLYCQRSFARPRNGGFCDCGAKFICLLGLVQGFVLAGQIGSGILDPVLKCTLLLHQDFITRSALDLGCGVTRVKNKSATETYTRDSP